MDKEYVQFALQSRIDLLHSQYRQRMESTAVNAVRRCELQKERDICMLVLELVNGVKVKNLSDEATRGLDKLCEPRRRQ